MIRAFKYHLILAALILWICTPRAHAELTQEQAAVIYNIAYGMYGSRHGGIPYPNPPVIHLTTPEKMAEMFGCHACRPLGLYRNGVVYLDKNLDPSKSYDASIVLHEMIHYFQDLRLGPTKDCEDWLAREREAFQIQIEALAKAHGDIRPVMMAANSYRCN